MIAYCGNLRTVTAAGSVFVSTSYDSTVIVVTGEERYSTCHYESESAAADLAEEKDCREDSTNHSILGRCEHDRHAWRGVASAPLTRPRQLAGSYG